MIDPSDVELAAMKKMPLVVRRGGRRDRFRQAARAYSEAEALRVIDAIVTCYTEAMVAHHEETSFRRCAAWPDARSDGQPFADWRTTCLGDRSHDRLQLHIEHLRPGSPPWSTRDAAGSRPPVRTPVPRGIASRRGLRARAAVRVRQAPIDHGRDMPGGCCGSSNAATSWRTAMVAWLRDAGFDLRTRKADGEQFGFSVADGRLQGHIDGVIVGGPEGFAYPALWECKMPATSPGAIWKKRTDSPYCRLRRASGDLPKPISNCTSTRRSSRHSTPTRWRSTPSSCPLTQPGPTHVGSGGQGHHGDRGRDLHRAPSTTRPL